jgi:hypothetical protein
MQKKVTGSEILVLSDILERIGMEETLRAVQFAAEWNAEVAAEIAENKSGITQQQLTFQDKLPAQKKHIYVE